MNSPENIPRSSFAKEAMVLTSAAFAGELIFGALSSSVIGQEKLDQLPLIQTSYIGMIGVTAAALSVFTYKYLMNQVPIAADYQHQSPEFPTSETE